MTLTNDHQYQMDILNLVFDQLKKYNIKYRFDWACANICACNIFQFWIESVCLLIETKPKTKNQNHKCCVVLCKDKLINAKLQKVFAKSLFIQCCRWCDFIVLKYIFSIEKYYTTKIDIMAVDEQGCNSFFGITSNNTREFEPYFDFLVNTVYKGDKQLIEKLINSTVDIYSNTNCPLLNTCQKLEYQRKSCNVSKKIEKLLLYGANSNIMVKVSDWGNDNAREPVV